LTTEDRRLGIGLVDEHSTPSRFISITRARCIARYKMHSVPGRPEELAQVTLEVEVDGRYEGTYPGKVISFGYAGGELRIRKHGGTDNREWLEHRDIRLRDGWLQDVYEFLDVWLGYSAPDNLGPTLSFAQPDGYAGPGEPFPTRPIRDNPQA